MFAILALIAICLIVLRAFFWLAQTLPYDLNEKLFDGYAETWALFTLLPPIYFLTPFPELYWGLTTDPDIVAFMAIGFTGLCVIFELVLFHRIVDFFCRGERP